MKRILLALYRLRGALYIPVIVVLLANIVVARYLSDGIRDVWTVIVYGALAVMVLCLVLILLGRWLVPDHEPRRVQSPVRGRWVAMNSPASKVPSHGIRMYGQSHAIDLVAEPDDGRPRPEFGGKEAMRANEEYPAFGEPVYAMIDGVVVRSSDWRRDHRARSNLLGYFYMMAEGVVRELGGPGFIVGNHVTIRSDDGVFATVAHLQRGSAEVQAGDRVTAGDRIGRCGNTGNSSEPHVHAQLMDRISLRTAQGMPFVFADVVLGDDSDASDGVPENGQAMATRP